jgi:hypothetical protein
VDVRPAHVSLLAIFAIVSLFPLQTRARDATKSAVPMIGGRAVPELVLTTPIHVGRQHRGMLIMPELTIFPNRFVPVREDAEGVYYQAVATFQPETVHGSGSTGGLYLSKAHPEKVWAYVGDARRHDPRTRDSKFLGDVRGAEFQPGLTVPLPPEFVRKLKVARAAR